MHYKVMTKTSNFGNLAFGYWQLTYRHNLNIITMNKVFVHGTINQHKTFCFFNQFFSTVIDWLSQFRKQWRTVNRKPTHRTRKKCVEKFELTPSGFGKINISLVMHALAIKGNLSHMSLYFCCGNNRCGNTFCHDFS